MPTKRVYRCEGSAVTRDLLCGKAKATSSCLSAGILGGRCPNLVTSTARTPETVAPEKTVAHRRLREAPKSSASQKKTMQKTVSGDVGDIIERIRTFRPHRKPSKERELGDMLVTHLRVWYPNVRTELSYENARIDAQIGRIGIEIKLSPDVGGLDRLYGQLDKYLDGLDSVIAVIFFERSRESTESFERRLTKRGWLNSRVFVLSCS